MGGVTSFITESRYYSPAFDAAIFDGPIRIYFAQFQEAAAVKLYFQIQTQLKSYLEQIKDKNKFIKQNLFIMIYPSKQTFADSFDGCVLSQNVVTAKYEGDYILGVNDGLDEESTARVLFHIEDIIKDWSHSLRKDLAVEVML